MDSEKSTDLHGPKPAVVGIGASAGGLSALRAFFGRVPEDSGLAFVVVVHLSPEHKSHLAEILQPHVRIPVQQVSQTVPLEPNRVYVIPPNRNLSAIDTHLRLSELEQRPRERAPIDHFFRTLAHTHDGHAVGIILTGTGSDGALGIKEIKEQGGLVVVQDPAEAEYDGMPQSAVTTGLVDLILPLAAIPAAVMRYAHTKPQVKIPAEEEEVRTDDEQVLQKLFLHLSEHAGRDFTRYKRSTILRRVARRMQLRTIEHLDEYLELVRRESAEASTLAEDLLITVTGFFRDPPVYQALEANVLRALVQGKAPGEELRVWSVGCATGEEAYSLAMLLLEHIDRIGGAPRIQVFASDLHARSLERAREGFYPGDIETVVSEERLRRFFVKESGGYRIGKEVRDNVVFAPHNLLTDPPFSRIDLLACRNLLIYLRREIQREVIELFHYAIRPNGFLLLGTSETVDGSDLFLTVDKAHRIYRRRSVPRVEPRLPVFTARPVASAGSAEARMPDGPVSYGSLHHKMVERYAPPSILVSPDDKVVHLSEHAGRLLVYPGGELTASIYKVVRVELRSELRAALQAAREQKKIVTTSPIALQVEGEMRSVVLRVSPADDGTEAGFALVFLDEADSAAAPHQGPPSPVPTARDRDAGDNLVWRLKEDLNVSQQRHQALIEEYETGQEEMKAANEELQSINEELRSTMEELETSKEELQSMNEELQTVNQENRHKVAELAQLSNDLQNLLTATDIATLFLDRDLRILRFTPRASELFNMRAADPGRPLSDLRHRLGYDDLLSDAGKVLRRLIPVERQVRDEDGRWYLARVLPYRSSEDRIEGVVMTFVETTRLMEAEAALLESKMQLAAELDALHDMHELVLRLIQCADLPTALNEVLTSAMSIYGADVGTVHLLDSNTKQLRLVASRELPADLATGLALLPTDDGSLWSRTLAGGRRLISNLGHPSTPEDSRLASDIGLVSVVATPLVSRDGEPLGVLSLYCRRPHRPSERDFRYVDLYCRKATEWIERMHSHEALRESEEQRHLALEAAGAGGWEYDAASGRVYLDASAREITGVASTAPRVAELTMMVVAEDRAEVERELASLMLAGVDVSFAQDLRLARKGGILSWIHLRGRLFFRPGSLRPPVLVRAAGVALDITERKEVEERLRETDRRKGEFLAMLGHELRNPLAALSNGLAILEVSDGNEAAPLRGMMQRQVVQLVHLIDDLLDVSRLGLDKLTLKMEHVDLLHVMREVLETSCATQPQHSLEVSLPAEPLFVEADPTRLAQVFHNLLNNACAFTPEGGKIRIEVQQLDTEARVAISDDGIGITQDKLATVFEMFVQANSPRPGSGLGLGLALVKRLVELHAGKVEVYSEGLGKGSSFVVRLPLAHGNRFLRGAPPASAARSEISGLRLLVVDDNQDAAFTLGMLLKHAGGEVATAFDGETAIEIAQTFEPDVVLLDIGLPGIDGYEVARRLRKQLAGQAAVVALTGFGQEKDRRLCFEAGFDAYLVKPVDEAVLRKVIAEAREVGNR
jgi:two-component system, chemotaxis family, CheB/CheR fusion protein